MGGISIATWTLDSWVAFLALWPHNQSLPPTHMIHVPNLYKIRNPLPQIFISWLQKFSIFFTVIRNERLHPNQNHITQLSVNAECHGMSYTYLKNCSCSPTVVLYYAKYLNVWEFNECSCSCYKWILSWHKTSATAVPHSRSLCQGTSSLIEQGTLVFPQSCTPPTDVK